LEEGKMNSQAPREMGEISARLECQDELETPPGSRRPGIRRLQISGWDEISLLSL
jgi:hypothetical protein